MAPIIRLIRPREPSTNEGTAKERKRNAEIYLVDLSNCRKDIARGTLLKIT